MKHLAKPMIDCTRETPKPAYIKPLVLAVPNLDEATNGAVHALLECCDEIRISKLGGALRVTLVTTDGATQHTVTGRADSYLPDALANAEDAVAAGWPEIATSNGVWGE